MSHYTRVKTKLKKRSCIVEALIAMGFKKHMVEVHEEAVPLKGYQGDQRKQKAHIRIKGSGWSGSNYVGSASNDLGLEQLADGSWVLHVSDYDRNKYGTQWQEKFTDQYSRATVKKHCKQHNFFVSEENVEEDGTIVMKLRSPFSEKKMPAEIEIRIHKGKISIEVSGVDDASCVDITRALEQDLGEVEEVQRKPEYYIELDGIELQQFEGEE